jgi:hypothetical protein
LDERLKTVKFDVKKYFERLSEKELDKIVNKDLNDALGLGLHELKNYVDYDLKLSKLSSASLCSASNVPDDDAGHPAL